MFLLSFVGELKQQKNEFNIEQNCHDSKRTYSTDTSILLDPYPKEYILEDAKREFWCIGG